MAAASRDRKCRLSAVSRRRRQKAEVERGELNEERPARVSYQPFDASSCIVGFETRFLPEYIPSAMRSSIYIYTRVITSGCHFKYMRHNAVKHLHVNMAGKPAVSSVPIIPNKKFELMLTRLAKAYSSSCSQIALVYLQIFSSQFSDSLLNCAAQPKITKKNNKTSYSESSRYFKSIKVDTTKKLVTSACCDRQHIRAYLQPFSR